MKKTSKQNRRFLIKRAHEGIRKQTSKNKTDSHQQPKSTRLIKEPVSSPDILDIDNKKNYKNTIDFFTKLRKLANDTSRRVSINFSKLYHITPAAALVLAAELDRIRRMHNCKLIIRHFPKWKKDIKELFRDLGIIELLQIGGDIPKSFMAEKTTLFFQFRSSDIAEGQLAIELSNAIGSQNIAIPKKVDIQTALSEAMINIEHAYPKQFRESAPFKESRWWMFASYDVQNEEITTVFYDQGIGIPKTLDVKFIDYMKGIRKIALPTFSLMDSIIIDFATEFGRNKLNLSNRGTGLYRMKKYIDLVGGGMLKIVSLKGEYHYLGKDIATKQIDHGQALLGTLIEWRIKV